jgi:hypothetical protein
MRQANLKDGQDYDTRSFDPHESPFLLSRPGEASYENESLCGQLEAGETHGQSESATPEFESQFLTESLSGAESEGRQVGGSLRKAPQANSLDPDPYATLRSAMAPEHANLEANELTVLLGRMPATIVLHQLVHSPQMRQATLASLLGKSARRSVHLNGSYVSIPAYLRMISRLCREVAEQSETEFGQETSSGEIAPQPEYFMEGETLGGSVGRSAANHPDDVKLVQHLINANLPIPLAPLIEDGICGSKTIFAIETYQQRTLGMNPPDGRVDIRGATFQSLTGGGVAPRPSPQPAPKAKTKAGTFPPEIITAAQASHTTWKVPASVTLSQWAIESAWGHAMPSGSNNPFGIKAAAGQPYVEAKTREVVNGKDIYIVARFRAFASFDEAFDQHGRLLATAKPYKHAMTLVDDPDSFADALTGVYATDPHYGAALKSVMKKYNLYQYD